MIGRPFCFVFGKKTLDSILMVTFSLKSKHSFSIIRKESYEQENLEALLFGMAGLLDGEKEDNYYKDLKSRFDYLSHKYQIERSVFEKFSF
jgi:hypothetical protein